MVSRDLSAVGSGDGLFRHGPADVDAIIRDHPEPDPTLHAGIAFVAAARESMSPLDHADAALASGAPFLAVAEPALLLQALALGTLARAIGNAHALDALRLRRRLVFSGVEAGVRRHQPRRAAEHRLMAFNRRKQQILVARPLLVDLVIGDNLVFRFLQFHHLAEFVGLPPCPCG